MLLLNLTVSAHEAVNATCRVNKRTLTRIEGVRGVRDFYFYQWVSFAFKFHRLVCFASGLRKEHIAVGHILEYDGAIVVGVNTFFHLINNYLLFIDFHIIMGCKITEIFAPHQIFC